MFVGKNRFTEKRYGEIQQDDDPNTLSVLKRDSS